MTFEACEKEKHLNSTHVISGGISARLAAGLPFRSVNLLSAARYQEEKDNEIFMIDFALISIARKVKVCVGQRNEATYSFLVVFMARLFDAPVT